jgi:hypothetical protein
VKRLSFLLLLLAGGARADDLKIATQLVYSRPSVAFQTQSGHQTPASLGSLVPNAQVRPGLEVRYRHYGVSVSTSLQDATYGMPRFFQGGLTDARTFYYGDAWGFEAYHRYARGFNTGDGRDDHPDMTLRSTSATIYRAAGQDFHVYRMADGITESGVEPDLLFTFGLSQTHLHDAEDFVVGTSTWGTRLEGLNDFKVYSGSLGAGLSLSSSAGGVYFDPALFVGFGVQYREWNGHPETTLNLVKVNLRMRLGYRNEGFDLGAGFENDAHTAMSGDESVLINAFLARVQIQVYL